MRLAFMGSPGFAVPALLALHAAGHEVVRVYAQPPRPAGRGQREQPCPVHAAALELGLAVRTPARLRRDAAEHRAFQALDLDAAVVAAYGLILPPEMLGAPRRGCLNIHASLLPRWRGAAPIQAAILAGDAESGVTIMRMEEGLDTGPMLLRETIALHPRITTPELHDALAGMGARLILRALAEEPVAQPQPEAGVTYAGKLSKADAPLDWRLAASVLDARVRALNPWPGTTARLAGETLRILDSEPGQGAGRPGEVLAAPGLLVACGEGALRVTRLQRAGRAPMEAEAFLRGHPIPPGTVLA
jgi:methionyl-tRNA formyltransferase